MQKIENSTSSNLTFIEVMLWIKDHVFLNNFQENIYFYIYPPFGPVFFNLLKQISD